MALKLTDPSTWTVSTLVTPEGPVKYWVLADWDSYYEQYEDRNNLTRVLIAVAWDKALTFKKYALGFAEKSSSSIILNRFTPLPCPWQVGQYLTSLKKYSVHAGVGTNGAAAWHEPDPEAENWPTFPDTDGMPPRIVYAAEFQVLDYDVVAQNSFRSGGFKELKRFVTRQQQFNARERRMPSYGFETDDGDATPIPEVGFIPFYDYEFTLTWRKIPINLVPVTAIKTCALKVNDDVFDYLPDTSVTTFLTGETWGRFAAGDILFKGLASRQEPYRGPNGEWLMDLPYVFSFQPADGAGNGQLKIPKADLTWVKVRARGSVADPKFLYDSANLQTLFRPEP